MPVKHLDELDGGGAGGMGKGLTRDLQTIYVLIYEAAEIHWEQQAGPFGLFRGCETGRGHSLFLAQQGGRGLNVKTLGGFGGGSVIEIVEDHDGGTYRCVYTTRLADVVAVLHAFQKKSKHGISTPLHEIELIRSRLRDALARNWSE